MSISNKEWYRRVNAEWPAQVPPLEEREAIAASKKLYRFAMRRTFRGRVTITTGNRYTWIYRGELRVNASKGWRDLVHLISHYAFGRLHEDRPHGSGHARLEMRMIREVKKRGWLEGKLRPKTKVVVARDPKEIEAERLEAARKRWITKSKRAATALKKIDRRLKFLDKKISAINSAP